MPPARYPNFEGKHGQDAIFSPAEVPASLTADPSGQACGNAH
jgi:hypothetical protein